MDIDDVIKLLREIQELSDSAKTTVRKAKPVAKRIKRAPSAYNNFMKRELKRLKKKHPRTSQPQLMKKAARSWRAKKRGK
jgi:hypothetical protein